MSASRPLNETTDLPDLVIEGYEETALDAVEHSRERLEEANTAFDLAIRTAYRSGGASLPVIAARAGLSRSTRSLAGAMMHPRPLSMNRSAMSNYLAWLLFTGVVGALLALAVYRAHVGRLRSTSRLGITLLSSTLALLFVGSAYGARLEQVGDINCQAGDGDYTYGDFGWSTAPPGPTCTFTEMNHGFDEVRGPSPVMSVWMALVAVGAATSAAMALHERTTSGRGQPSDSGVASPSTSPPMPQDARRSR